MSPGQKAIKALGRMGYVVSRFQDRKTMSESECADIIDKALEKKTPGQRVVEAFRSRQYNVVASDLSGTSDSEIAGIIEQESGIVDIVDAVEKLLIVCKYDDIRPHVRGHVELVERTIQEVMGK